MNSSSKVIMEATMVMVLSLVLFLLAELYCPLLLRGRRQHSLYLPITTVSPAATTTITLNQAISTTTNEPSPSNNVSSSPNLLYTGILQTPKPTKTHLSNTSLYLIQETNDSSNHNKPTASSIDSFIYISNPIYTNEAKRKPTTPFETPDSSPSRLDTGDSSYSSSEEDNDITPTLTPMKYLPEKACSVSLKDVKLSTSESNNGGGSSSSSGSPYTSPSGSPYTSPSW